MIIQLIIFFNLLITVLGNTESLILSIPKDLSTVDWETSDSYPTEFTELSPGTLNLTLISNYSYNTELDYSINNEKDEILFIKLIDNNFESYNIRICWPAIYPASIDINPIIINQETFIKISYHSKFYSRDSMLTDLKIPIQLHMIELEFGIVPKDIIPIIKIILTITIITIPSIWFVLNFLQNSQ